MRRLIYTSRVARQVRLDDAEAIASSAALRNQQAGITGILLYTPSYFLQVLEGEGAALRGTFGRIRGDSRHHDVRIVDERDVNVREFDSWSMTARFCAAPPGVLEQLDLERALALLRDAASALLK